jgi:hypothetical protein
MMRIRNRPRTLGDLISTVCFAGMAMWLAGEALLAAQQSGDSEDGWRTPVLWVSSGLCLLGALRNVVSGLWLRLFGTDDR